MIRTILCLLDFIKYSVWIVSIAL